MTLDNQEYNHQQNNGHQQINAVMTDQKTRKIVSLPVYSIAEGQHLGYVKNLVLDPTKKAIIALVAERSIWTKEEKVILFENITSIGEDAITVAKSSQAERLNNAPQILRYLRRPVYLIGSRIFTVGGRTLGKVEEFWFNITTGEISSMEISGGSIGNILKSRTVLSAQHIITIANGAVMVDNSAPNQLQLIENNFQIGIESAKEKAQEVLQDTVDASIKLGNKFGKNFTNSLNKIKGQDEDEQLPLESTEPQLPTYGITPPLDGKDSNSTAGRKSEQLMHETKSIFPSENTQHQLLEASQIIFLGDSQQEQQQLKPSAKCLKAPSDNQAD